MRFGEWKIIQSEETTYSKALIPSLNKYLSRICIMAGTILDAEDTAINESGKS